MSKKERSKIRERMSQISSEIESELDFREFGASSDLDYELSDARLAALNKEYQKLETLLQKYESED